MRQFLLCFCKIFAWLLAKRTTQSLMKRVSSSRIEGSIHVGVGAGEIDLFP